MMKLKNKTNMRISKTSKLLSTELICAHTIQQYFTMGRCIQRAQDMQQRTFSCTR